MSLFQPYPDKIYVGITDKCNANCIMCWRNGESNFEDMNDSVIANVVELLPFIKEVGWWSAGEFFSYSKIDWFLDELKIHPKVRHSFSTNAIELSNYAEKLSDINISEITISIDGATDDTLENIRIGVKLDDIKNGITEVKKWFTRKNRTIPNLKFIFVGMKRNISEFPQLVDLAYELEVNEVWLEKLILHPKCNLEQEALYRYDGLEKEMYSLAEDKAKKLGVNVGHIKELC